MASTCIHDGRVVCASSPDGCSRKSFLDQCDMYEYNCDYGTRYQETYILFCGTFLTPKQFTQIQSMTNSAINKGFNNIKSSLKQRTITLTKNEKYQTDNEINFNTVPLLTITSEEIIVKHKSNENVSNKIDNNQNYVNFTNVTGNVRDNVTHRLFDQITNIYENENNITSNTINKKISQTVKLEDTALVKNTEAVDALEQTKSFMEEVTKTIPAYCCDRPLTWATTTELTKFFEDIQIDKNNSDENKQITENSTKYNNTDDLIYQTSFIYEKEKNITLFTKNKQISHIVTFSNTTQSESTTIEALEQNQFDMETVNQTTPIYCCNRPLTWETTTEIINVVEDIAIENNNSEENKMDKKDGDINGPMQTMADLTEADSYTKGTTKYSDTPNVKLHMTTPIKLPWLTKLSNNCNKKCKRPLTWLTTTTFRKKYF